MTINIAGLVVLVIGAIFLAIAIVNPRDFIVYKLLVGRATPCAGEGNERKWIAAYSVIMMVFGLLLMLRVFGKKDEGE